MTRFFFKLGKFRERNRVIKQKIYLCVSRYFHYLPPVLAILLPIGSWPFLSEQQWRYGYFLFPVVSSLGWLFAIGLRENTKYIRNFPLFIDSDGNIPTEYGFQLIFHEASIRHRKRL